MNTFIEYEATTEKELYVIGADRKEPIHKWNPNSTPQGEVIGPAEAMGTAIAHVDLLIATRDSYKETSSNACLARGSCV
jgi:hypothetical protein